MERVETPNNPQVIHLFQDLAAVHLSVAAVCQGTVPGEIYVDTLEHPAIGLARTPEGEYVVGDAARETAYPALRALIPETAYLILEPDYWVQVLGQIWANPVARRHPRLHLRWQRPDTLNWRGRLPSGFDVVAIDEELLGRTDLRNHHEITDRMTGWHSTDDFLQNGFGFCGIWENTIVSRCMADCLVGNRCEIGVGTDVQFRRKGMALAVVTATIEHCLSRGITHIGWHCLRSNLPSRALAEKAGFRVVAEYDAYSAVLPAENATDLTPEAYADWAIHYERHAASNAWYRLFAVEAWALAGERARALDQLRLLAQSNWPGSADSLSRRWALQSLLDAPEYHSIMATMRGESDGGGV